LSALVENHVEILVSPNDPINAEPSITPPAEATITTFDDPTALLEPPETPPEETEAAKDAKQAYHRLHLDQETGFWEKYVHQADTLDKELVKTLSEDLNNLLIFVSSP